MSRSTILTRNIFIALLSGAAIGLMVPEIVPWISWLGLIFKLSLAMIVMPIVFTSICSGMGTIGDIRQLGKLGISTIAYFFLTTFLAIILGLCLVSLWQPGIRAPSLEIQQALEDTVPLSRESSPQLFIQTLRGHPSLNIESHSLQYIEQSLTQLAEENMSVEQIRKAASALVGSLEFRDRMTKEHRGESFKLSSPKELLKSQLTNAILNPFEALANKQVLAVIIFTILFGGALGTVGAQGKIVFDFIRIVDAALGKMVSLIMRFAPLGVFGITADVVASTGFGIFRELGLYSLCVISGLFIHGAIILPLLMWGFSGYSPKTFFIHMRSALAVAFATSSSTATLPLTINCVEENLKISQRISRFVLPLGATINMNGTALYEAVAAVFIAQLYGISLSISSHIVIAITAALAAVGTAGIPAAGTVTMALVLSAVGLPLEGIGFLMAVDRPLDMFRTVVNVGGDAVGTVILERFNRKAN